MQIVVPGHSHSFHLQGGGGGVGGGEAGDNHRYRLIRNEKLPAIYVHFLICMLFKHETSVTYDIPFHQWRHCSHRNYRKSIYQECIFGGRIEIHQVCMW